MLELSINKEFNDISNPQWKPIVIDNTTTDYLVSNCGWVWSKKSQKLLSPSKNKNGYMNLILYVNGNSHNVEIHRLVAIAFIPNPDNKLQVNHKDGNKTRNWHGNLEWMTQQENIQHAIDTGLRDSFLGVNSPKNIYPEETIHKICKLLEEGNSQLGISKLLNVNKGVVNSIKQRKMWKHISKNYNIPKPISRKNPRPLGLRSKVIEMLNSGITDKSEILSILGLPDDRRNRTYIAVVKTELKSKVAASTTIEPLL